MAPLIKVAGSTFSCDEKNALKSRCHWIDKQAFEHTVQVTRRTARGLSGYHVPYNIMQHISRLESMLLVKNPRLKH